MPRPHSTTSERNNSSDLLAEDIPATITTVESVGVLPGNESTILPDVLDETSVVFRAPVQVLVGNRISTNLSTRASHTIARAQMEVTDALSGFQLEDYGWTSPTEYPTWFTQLLTDSLAALTSSPPSGGSVMLCSTPTTTIYVDPDQGGLEMYANIPVYSHMAPFGIVEPVINSSGLTLQSDSKYGPSTYIDPIFYDPKEERGLYDKFGFDAVTYSPDAYGATYERMEDELQDLLSMMSVETSPRANIRFGLKEETPRLISRKEVALLPPSKLA